MTKMKQTKFIAHAGIHLGSTIAGKNSIESMKTAGRAGFDFCEIDIRETSDGFPVALHDETLNSTFRNRSGYSALENSVYVKDITLDEFRSRYVLKADRTEDRAQVPTLGEIAEAAGQIGIIPMIHPKISRPDYLDRAVSICTSVCGKNGFYIVSEDEAVRYVLSKDPEQCTMMIVKDFESADEFARYPNCILAVSFRHPEYEKLVMHCLEMGKHVETTLQNDMRTSHLADVINYDYLSPSKFEQYNMLETIENRLSYVSGCGCIEFGTARLDLFVKGNVKADVCGRTFCLCSEKGEHFSIPVLVYDSVPSYLIEEEKGAETSDIFFKTASH